MTADTDGMDGRPVDWDALVAGVLDGTLGDADRARISAAIAASPSTMPSHRPARATRAPPIAPDATAIAPQSTAKLEFCNTAKFQFRKRMTRPPGAESGSGAPNPQRAPPGDVDSAAAAGHSGGAERSDI